MSKYVDVYLLPIPKENLPEYRKLARSAGRIFRKHGALTYREYAESDLNVQEITPFPNVIKLKDDETLIYAAVEFKSESHRNKVMKAIFADPEMQKMMPQKPLFDMKRMVYGGFSLLVEV
jgi:uncharacterized protein YbaA (DUF1428 family)